MQLYEIVGIGVSLGEGLAILAGEEDGFQPAGIVFGIYQGSVWIGVSGSEGPGGALSVDFGPGGPSAEIAELVAGGAVGEDALWKVTLLDLSALVRRFGFAADATYWVVRYIAFSHSIREGVYISEGQDYRPD